MHMSIIKMLLQGTETCPELSNWVKLLINFYVKLKALPGNSVHLLLPIYTTHPHHTV